MLSLEDDACIDDGICADLLPQYFELTDGSVRIRSGADDGPDEREARGEAREVAERSSRP
jgi:ferredoxin